VSEKAKEFVRKILVADPEKRISVEQALEDPWITGVER
jgi:serine/threonine protein kinase